MLPTPTEFERTPTEPFSIGRPDGAVLEVTGSDPRLEVVAVQGVLTMTADLGDAGAFDAFLALKIDGNFVTFSFHKGMDRQDFLDEIRRGLPPGYELELPKSSNRILVIEIVPTPSRGGSPEVGFFCTDPTQRVRFAGKNKFVIEGRAARSLSVRSELDLEIEGRHLRVILQSGDHPIATATRLRSVLPLGYSALIELPLFEGAEVAVTILRRKG
jgi:hypothetical protein